MSRAAPAWVPSFPCSPAGPDSLAPQLIYAHFPPSFFTLSAFPPYWPDCEKTHTREHIQHKSQDTSFKDAPPNTFQVDVAWRWRWWIFRTKSWESGFSQRRSQQRESPHLSHPAVPQFFPDWLGICREARGNGCFLPLEGSLESQHQEGSNLLGLFLKKKKKNQKQDPS